MAGPWRTIAPSARRPGDARVEPPPAKFFVNQGVVTSRDGHAQPPPAAAQADRHATATCAAARSIAHGTGWVERIVVDADDISTYFTPLAITLNIDSFEHLEFETRPDQLLVYTLVQGDERVVVEFAPIGPDGDDGSPFAPRQLEFDTERLRPDGAAGPRRRRRRRERIGRRARRRFSIRPRARPARTARPSAAGAPTRLRTASRDPMTTTTITSMYGSISRKNVADRPAWNGFATPRIVGHALDVEDEPEDRPEQVGPERGPQRAPLGEDHEARRRSSRGRRRSARRTSRARSRA